MDADVYPKDRPELSIVIDGAIGELSIFHSTFGYYAHGVGEETAILPLGWEGRLVKVENENTFGAIGWCLEVHDLAVSKLLAGRDKDVDFVGVMMGAGMVKVSILKGQCLSPFPTSQSRRGDAGVYHAGGMKAISRRLRSDATTPPVCQTGTACIPEGC